MSTAKKQPRTVQRKSEDKSMATVMRQIAQAHEATEATADLLLESIRQHKAVALADFDSMVTQAYVQNGWSQRIGRPQGGDVQAPAIVKVYVSTIRAAYRLDLSVATYTTLYALRQDVRKARAAHPQERPAADPALAGLSVQSPGSLTGAVLHDLCAVRLALAPAEQKALDAALSKVLAMYVKKAPPVLKVVGGKV